MLLGGLFKHVEIVFGRTIRWGSMWREIEAIVTLLQEEGVTR